MEESELSRTIRLTNLYKQVLELTPFEKGSRELVKDVRFMRYLVLCLPFNEDVIEKHAQPLITYAKETRAAEA